VVQGKTWRERLVVKRERRGFETKNECEISVKKEERKRRGGKREKRNDCTSIKEEKREKAQSLQVVSEVN